jgi:hypothetical protein
MLVLLLTLFGAPVPAQPEPPKGAPPQIWPVKLVDGTLVGRRTETVVVPVFRQVKVNVGGKEEIQSTMEYVPTTRTMERRWSLDKATISEAGGKKLDKEALAKRLEKRTVVVLSSDGKPVAPGYLKVFQKETLVIVLAPGSEKPPPPDAGEKKP